MQSNVFVCWQANESEMSFLPSGHYVVGQMGACPRMTMCGQIKRPIKSTVKNAISVVMLAPGGSM